MSEFIPIRPAVRSDLPAISSFLASARFIHRHLDWHTVYDWLGYQPFYLSQDANRILSILAYPQDPPGIAWIRCFAIAPLLPLQKIWQEIFLESLKNDESRNAMICAVGLQEWFANLLKANQFTHFQDIIVLAWNRKMPSPRPLTRGFIQRAMLAEDIDEVAEVDRISFEPLWVNSANTLRLAFEQSESTEVIEYQGRIIAYQMSTSNHFSAHLARLAVLPDFQRNNIGFNLVYSMIRQYAARGITQITVNTQHNNQSSLALYDKIGFEYTGEHYPILLFNR